MTELIDFNKEKKKILTERAAKDKKVIFFPTISTSWTQKLDGKNPSIKCPPCNGDKEDE